MEEKAGHLRLTNELLFGAGGLLLVNFTLRSRSCRL
jgi:hypothetical protein